MPHDSLATPRESIRRFASVVTPRSAILAALIGLTSVAVGATTTLWFVPPYLVAMGWLLLAPARPRSTSIEQTAVEEAGVPVTIPDVTAVEVTEPPAESSAKPKKSRAKAKAKPKAKEIAIVPPMIATWVQVAPGKFVRVEVPAQIDPTEEPSFSPSADGTCEVHAAEVETPSTEGNATQVPVEAEPRNDTIAEPADPIQDELELAEPEPPTEWVDPPNPPRVVIESEEYADHEPDAPVEDSRLVATGEATRPGFSRSIHGRSIRIRRDPRPKARRGNGRIGASPRVILHRA